MATDEESIDRRKPIGEAIQRHFKIFGPGRSNDHPRLVRLIGCAQNAREYARCCAH
jgi:hypothetical protein